jgi:phosphate-selective porin OprO/OprP
MPASASRTRLLLALAGLAMASPALAQDAARLQAIEQQIRALQTELARLRRDAAARDAETRAAREEAARARAEAQAAQRREVQAAQRREAQAAEQRSGVAAPPAAAPPPPETGRLTFPGNRPTFTSADGRFAASVGGQVQFDVGGYLRGSPGTPDNRGVPNMDNFGQNLRRGRLIFGLRYDDFSLNVTPDFGGSPDGSPTLYEASFNWNPVRPLTLTLGYYKPWYSLQDSMSSNDFLFLERPSIVEVARNVSAGDGRASVGGRWAENRYFVSGYLTGGSYGGNSAAQGVPDQTGGVVRIAGRPIADPDLDLHLGLSGSYAFDIRRTAANGQQLQLRDRPELRIDQSRLIDTGLLNADRAYTWGPEFGLRWRNFLLQGEYIRIGVEQSEAAGVPRPDLGFEGGYVEASWVLTGEPRLYSTSGAAFGRPNPREPFSLHGGGWGAWEVMARYSVADLNDRLVRGRSQASTGGAYGGRQEVVGMGVSWYPNNLLRFMLNWDIVQVDRLNTAGTIQIGQRFHTIALRTQLAF